VFIKVEPKEFFMYSVTLVYDLESPNTEDQEVKDYLAEHELEPKYQGTGEYEGRQSEVMYFGGCYLGRHLQRIGEIQRRAVEAEIIEAEIEHHLAAASNNRVTIPDGCRKETVAKLVQEFHNESSFQTNEDGELYVSLEEDAVVEAARRVLAELPRG
jgi:hypothetical protein